MSKEFKCETCRKAAERLHMRDADGRWVCAYCLPDVEVNRCPGLRERLGLPVARAAAQQRRKAA